METRIRYYSKSSIGKNKMVGKNCLRQRGYCGKELARTFNSVYFVVKISQFYFLDGVSGTQLNTDVF